MTVSDIARGVYPPAGPQPPPLMTQVEIGLGELPGPAKLALGITAGNADGLLREGWRWRSFRSVAFRHAPKRLEEPERWVSCEVVSLRLAGPPFRLPRRLRTGVWASGSGRTCQRVVICWTRDLVTLAKANRSKRTGVRPAKSASWGSEAWAWVPGLTIPTAVDVTTAKTIIRRNEA